MRGSTPSTPSAKVYGVALTSGAVLWILTCVAGGRAEAWDSPLYWSCAYPLSLAVAAALGAWWPARAGRPGASVVLGQGAVPGLQAASFGLWPLGVIVFALLALPAAGAGRVGGWLRTRLD